jgi:hypothetical protein
MEQQRITAADHGTEQIDQAIFAQILSWWAGAAPIAVVVLVSIL